MQSVGWLKGRVIIWRVVKRGVANGRVRIGWVVNVATPFDWQLVFFPGCRFSFPFRQHTFIPHLRNPLIFDLAETPSDALSGRPACTLKVQPTDV